MMSNNKIPKHVVVIPDGNRRWAKKRGLQPWEGHDVGAKMIEKIVRKARELGIQYISIWGSSKENLVKRPMRERQELINIYTKYFEKLINSEEVEKDDVRINIIGGWREQLPKNLVNLLEEGIEKTKYHHKYHVNFFLSYSGDDEMLAAIREIIKNCHDSATVTKDTVKKHLFTKDLPPVDYLIRTGGEPHLSTGFMMWDIANAQLFFSDLYFPEFDDGEFEKAIADYARRMRRHGA
ncbi:MAG: polyprenyl diphosphate synthase [Parcubacteria group bacterium]|jgi:undecaprenyl diphosphate synthase